LLFVEVGLDLDVERHVEERARRGKHHAVHTSPFDRRLEQV
jgi:hypothetical protein